MENKSIMDACAYVDKIIKNKSSYLKQCIETGKCVNPHVVEWRVAQALDGCFQKADRVKIIAEAKKCGFWHNEDFAVIYREDNGCGAEGFILVG